VVVLEACGHSERSILQSEVQRSAPPGDGHVKPPKALPSHSSPGSSTPLPHNLAAVVVVVLVVLVEVVDDVLLVVVVVGVVEVLLVVLVTSVDVVVEAAGGPSEKSILQSDVHSSAPPGDGHVKPPNALPSHSSPGSRIPLPHNPLVVVVVVEDGDVVVDEVLVVV